MQQKTLRFSKIRTFLRMQSEASTVTEVFQALRDRMNLEISRKTVERDLLEMVELREIAIESELPLRFVYVKPSSVEVKLSHEELQSILEKTSPDSPLYMRMMRLL